MSTDLSRRNHPLSVHRGWFHHCSSYEYLLWGRVPALTSGDFRGSVLSPDFPWSVNFTSGLEGEKQLLSTHEFHSLLTVQKTCVLTDPEGICWMIKLQACPFKRIRSVSLRPEGTSLMISDKLAMLFNMTKTEVLLLPGCPQLTLHHTSLGTVSITFDKIAAGLP